jgi:hypothetical protein
MIEQLFVKLILKRNILCQIVFGLYASGKRGQFSKFKKMGCSLLRLLKSIGL